MRFGSVPVDQAEGAILAHSVTASGRTWRKATALCKEDISALRAGGITMVIVAIPDADDLDENAAAARIAAALAAPGVDVRPPATGRVNLYAVDAGLFVVNRAAVDAINAIDPAITLATLPEYAPVDAGRMLATVKIIPFAVSFALVERAVEVARQANVFKLRPFRPRRVGIVQTVLPTVKASVLDKTMRITTERLSRSGSIVTRELRTAHDEAEVAKAVADLAADNEMVIVFGASAVSDARDVIPSAIGLAGGKVERVGMPVDPGNLLVVGRLGDKPVIGAPGCARSPKLNGFDWVLDRILADVEVGDREIASMGVGGLLMEIESRPQPREPLGRRISGVHAVLLAAGRGQRMGGPNKLLARFDGKPLVRKVAEVLVNSSVKSSIAVLGHQADELAHALEGLALRVVRNPDYKSGLASSLKAGIAALPPDAGGALVVLGDMPAVTSADIDALVAAFLSGEGKVIVRATHAGKRGNPVILPRSLFASVADLAGDTGARHIVESAEMAVIDVELGEAASLDVDTPEAMALAGGILES